MSDVCLILEGTYPYVTGGVSTCVYQLIKNTPFINYSIVYIGGSENHDAEYRYPIPENVKLIKEIQLFDYEVDDRITSKKIDIDTKLLYQFHKGTKSEKGALFKDVFENIIKPNDDSFDPFDILKSKEAWEYLSRFYKERFKGEDAPSFIDYFYTWRFTHYPLFKILTAEIPKAKLYHSLSTGYAGLLGAVAKVRGDCSFMLTEHGIYSHEREIEIYQAEWIFNAEKDLQAKGSLSIFKEWWVKLFHFMGSVAYENADLITTIYEGNKLKQIKYGANEDKIEVIPNGIDFNVFSNIQRRKELDIDYHIALVGRVVPIKDIKTFIKSISGLKRKLGSKKLKVSILGPYDEDVEYYEECRKLVDFFTLHDVITFTGKVDVKEYYGKIDLLVLSSISEGQPMVILEGFAAGIPCVSTDVGSCRELVYGISEEDCLLGKAGEVIPFGKPDLMAESIYTILSDSKLLESMGIAARERAKRYYREDITVKKYLTAYNKLLGKVN